MTLKMLNFMLDSGEKFQVIQRPFMGSKSPIFLHYVDAIFFDLRQHGFASVSVLLVDLYEQSDTCQLRAR